MSFADKLRAEGEAAGIAKGRVETLVKQLTLKFGPSVPRQQAGAIASIEELDRIAERILSAGTLREVFGEKKARATKTKRKR